MADDDPDRKEFDWDLHVMVPSIGVSRTIRVTSNESVGAVMIKLATKLGEQLVGYRELSNYTCRKPRTSESPACVWLQYPFPQNP